MANKENEVLKTITKKIDSIKKEIPNLVIPTMGIIEDNNKININNKDLFTNKEIKED